MAETLDLNSGPDLSTSPTDPSQPSNVNFWYQILTSNQEDQQHTLQPSTSSLDSEWGHVFDKSSKKKRQRMDTNSGAGSGVNSASDLSEALSAVSAALSLSSSASSGEKDQWEKEGAEFIRKGVEELPDEMVDNSNENPISFDIQSLPSESSEDDVPLSDSNENNSEIPSTWASEANGETWKSNSQVPELGMVFSSEEEAYEFYKSYADEIGFNVRKGKVQRLTNKAIRKRYFFCSREGFRQKKELSTMTKYKRKETRTGCNAKIHCTVENGKWVISQVSLEHNHPLEDRRRVIGSHTKTNSEAPLMICTDNQAEMAKDVGNKGVQSSNMGCTVCVPDKRINSLQPEAAQCLLNYFRRLQVEDLSFFYAVQLDSNGFTTNFFWRDGRSKVDYDYFGDVLILDKTFRIEEHNIICAPLWGLNHHRQQVLFGCAFLQNESTDSFVWLLETFMEAMDRHQPKTIFTDENELMVDAVKAVLPDAEHRIGIWYIRQNALKHLSALYMQPGFEFLFNKCISDCQTEEEFESRWESLLERFDLSENPWLSRLYKSRQRWACVLLKKTFCAGLQHGENIKSVFQIPKNENTGLLEFAQQYLEEVKKRRLEELDEDFQCNGTAQVTILTSSAIERQAADIYTCTLFKTFQEEFLKCLSVTIEETASNETITTYKLTEEGQKESVVEFNCLDSRVACSCKKFESFGILCVHALKVLNARNIFHIPHKYVLKRWTKSAKCGLPYEYEQEMADEMKQRTVNMLMRKTLNIFTKRVAIEDSKKIAGDYLGKTLEQIEDVLRAKADHREMIDMSRGSSDGLGKQPEISLFSPSLQVDSRITTKDDGDRGIRDSEVDTAKTSDYEENQLIRRKLGLSKKQSHTLQEIFKIHNPFTPSTLRLALAGQLKLDPVTVDDWFRMKRERTKLKQTEAIDDEENGLTRKKLGLSIEQSAFLEKSFKEHNTLNTKQKLALAKQLNLRPRQVEVWFQNRRARTKLKQTEVDCEYLKRCCETLEEENRRLLKAISFIIPPPLA
ncbi:hypothetical protein POTOM_051514 [Populus tomentosa]|uniref:Protein FAR1-RELATED SEQUENCE n=1 Tax=Populus tomentosa TaxID=118781 RepID=A0A8X8C705_POPTO|nr:hypothetical protein POTOM_051514 [Populus tomentosa]